VVDTNSHVSSSAFIVLYDSKHQMNSRPSASRYRANELFFLLQSGVLRLDTYMRWTGAS